MKLKKILKHMAPDESIQIYAGDGVWVNSLASDTEVLKYMDKKVKNICVGTYRSDATLSITLEDEE